MTVVVDESTPHLELPLPNAQNDMHDDVARISESLEIVDAAVNGLATDVAGRGLLAIDLASLSTVPATVGVRIHVAGTDGGDFEAVPGSGAGDGFYNIPSSSPDVKFVRKSLNSKRRDVSNLAVLRAIAGLQDGDIVTVKEHTAGLGYGGGNFVVDSTITQADDNGIYIHTVDTKLRRTFSGPLKTSFYGINGLSTDYAKVLSAIQAHKNLGKKLKFDAGNHLIAGRCTFDFDNVNVEFDDFSFLTPTTDDIAILVFRSATKVKNVRIKNPKIVTAGYGADSDGLIQITNVTDFEIFNPVIVSNRTAALARSRVYNGINTAISDNGKIIGGNISGTPKSGIHISTASLNVKAYDVVISDTGNNATGTYGMSPGGDCGGYGGNGFIRCKAYNTQGEAFLIMAETHATYGDQTCFGNIIESCSGSNTGKSAIRQGTFSTGIYPRDTKIIDNAFDTSGEHGLQISAGTGYSRNNKFKNTQLAGLYLTSDAEFIQWKSIDDDVENFGLVNSASWNAFLVGTVSSAIIESPKMSHDFVGVTGSNVFGVGTISGKTATLMRVLDPYFNGITQPWRLQGTITAGHIRYAGVGAPGGSGIPNGSKYSRYDGSGTTDNEYIRRGSPSAWVGIA